MALQELNICRLPSGAELAVAVLAYPFFGIWLNELV